MFQTTLQNIFLTMFQTMLQNKLIFQTMFQTIFQTNITKPITPYPIPLFTVRNQEVEKLLNHPCCWFSVLSSRLARSEAHTSRRITTNIKFITKPNLSQPWQVRRTSSPPPKYARCTLTSTHVLTWRSQPKELFNLAVTRGWSCSAGTIEIVLHQTHTTTLGPKDRSSVASAGPEGIPDVLEGYFSIHYNKYVS